MIFRPVRSRGLARRSKKPQRRIAHKHGSFTTAKRDLPRPSSVLDNTRARSRLTRTPMRHWLIRMLSRCLHGLRWLLRRLRPPARSHWRAEVSPKATRQVFFHRIRHGSAMKRYGSKPSCPHRLPHRSPSLQTGNAGLVCRRCGVSRPTLRKWV